MSTVLIKEVVRPDKIEKLRKQLERQNEEMVSKKIEDLRLENEKKMTKKLTAAF